MVAPRATPEIAWQSAVAGQQESVREKMIGKWGDVTPRWRSAGWAVLLLGLAMPAAPAGDWGRFRGPNGTGVADESGPLPTQIGPDANLIWKVDLPNGISSPVVGGGRVLMTTDDGKQLETWALDARTGKTLWRTVAPRIHKTKGQRLATASPVTDGERVVSFFQTSGLLCYDMQGRLQWRQDVGPLKNQFNHAASPILVDNRLLLVVDHDGDSMVVALEKTTGQELWRSYRFICGRNYASPVVWKFGGRQFVVVAGSGLIVGYDVVTGTPEWYVRGTSAVANPTPIVSADQTKLFVHSQSPPNGARSSPFRGLRERYDTSADGVLQVEELPASFLKTFFAKFDQDRSGGVDEAEYGRLEGISQPFVKGMVAIRPGGKGDLTDTNVVWTQTRSMPRTPSAICHQDVLYVVNESGVLQTFSAGTGELLHKDRLAARGTIYSSLALGDGKLFVGTRDGAVAVVSAEAEWQDLHNAKLDGEIQASPAIADGRVYFRTSQSLYCFGHQASPVKTGGEAP